METIPMEERLRGYLEGKQCRWEVFLRMRMVCMICMGMSGNGAGTGMGLIQAGVRETQVGRLAGRAAWHAAVAGAATAGACGLPIVTSFRPVVATSIWASALPLGRKFWVFTFLPFGISTECLSAPAGARPKARRKQVLSAVGGPKFFWILGWYLVWPLSWLNDNMRL